MSAFPEQLGPFGVVPTSFNSKFFYTGGDTTLSPNSHAFLVGRKAFTTEPLHALAQYVQEFPLHGQLSPSHPVTLNDVTKVEAKIPVSATHFAWSYPVAGLKEGTVEQADLGDPDTCFLLIGGYIYFNKDGRVVAMNALFPALDPAAGGLYFSKPNQWDSGFTPYLAKLGRFQSITIKALNDLGAHYFAWVLPNEELVSVTGERQRVCPNGGFVYLFHKDVYSDEFYDVSRDRFFTVVGPDEFARALGGELLGDLDEFDFLDDDLDEYVLPPKIEIEPSAPDEGAVQKPTTPSFPHIDIPDHKADSGPQVDASRPVGKSIGERIAHLRQLSGDQSFSSNFPNPPSEAPRQRKSVSDMASRFEQKPEETEQKKYASAAPGPSQSKPSVLRDNPRLESQFLLALSNQLGGKRPPIKPKTHDDDSLNRPQEKPELDHPQVSRPRGPKGKRKPRKKKVLQCW